MNRRLDHVGSGDPDAAFAAGRNNARFAICGMTESDNGAMRTPYLMRVIAARIQLRGFVYADCLPGMGEFYRDMAGWVASGQVSAHETVRDGVEAMPEAFLDLFRGANIGEMLVRV